MSATIDGTYSFRLTKAQFQTFEGTVVVVRRKRRFPSPFNLTMSPVTERIAVADAQGAPPRSWRNIAIALTTLSNLPPVPNSPPHPVSPHCPNRRFLS
jgi:hypothetical protein